MDKTDPSAKIFYAVLVNSATAAITNNFVWFAVTFWVYLQTKSVLVTSVMAGLYMGVVALLGFFLGSLVDRYPKKVSMLGSSLTSMTLYAAAAALYHFTPSRQFVHPESAALWSFIGLSFLGAIAGNLRTIALSTLVTVLVPEEKRDKANGLVGTTTGISFLCSSIFSGLAIGYLGVFWTLVIAAALTALVIAHLSTLHLPLTPSSSSEEHSTKIDVRGTIRVINLVPGLFGLIFFSMFNNFLGGVFMSLMDAYGLLLVSVQVWGFLWGFLSLGFIIGGLVVARQGLGKNPLRTLFLCNVVMWFISIFFTARASITLLAGGCFVYLCLIPAVEAAEQTILQKVIPPERQGRVFGFAQSLEQAAAPLSALVVGPIAQYVFIPFMTTGAGARLIGSWFGTGQGRGIALLFCVSGIIGLIVTLLAMRTRSYRLLAQSYQKA